MIPIRRILCRHEIPAEQLPRLPDDHRVPVRPDRNRHHRIPAAVEQLRPVRRPLRADPTADRHLPGPLAGGEAPHQDLAAAGDPAGVRQPTRVGRQLQALLPVHGDGRLVELGDGAPFRNVQGAEDPVTFIVDQVASVTRPVHADLVRAALHQHLRVRALVERRPVDVPRTFARGGESQLVVVRAPDRPGVDDPGRETPVGAALQVADQHVGLTAPELGQGEAASAGRDLHAEVGRRLDVQRLHRAVARDTHDAALGGPEAAGHVGHHAVVRDRPGALAARPRLTHPVEQAHRLAGDLETMRVERDGVHRAGAREEQPARLRKVLRVGGARDQVARLAGHDRRDADAGVVELLAPARDQHVLVVRQQPWEPVPDLAVLRIQPRHLDRLAALGGDAPERRDPVGVEHDAAVGRPGDPGAFVGVAQVDRDAAAQVDAAQHAAGVERERPAVGRKGRLQGALGVGQLDRLHRVDLADPDRAALVLVLHPGETPAVRRHGHRHRIDRALLGTDEELELHRRLLRDLRRRPQPAPCRERQRDRRHGRRGQGPGRAAGKGDCPRFGLIFFKEPRQVDTHVAGVPQAIARILHEATPHHASQPGRHRLGQLVPLRLRPQHRGQRVGNRLAAVGPLGRQHLVDHATEGPDVGARVHLLPARLLGAHVGGGAHDHAGLRRRRGDRRRQLRVVARRAFLLERLRQPEVQHLDRAVRRQRDVRRLQVAVHDAVVVRGLERFGNPRGDAQRLLDRQRPLLEHLRQVAPVDQLHRQEAHPVDLVQPVDRRDVRMVQRGQQLRLALEAGQAHRVGRQPLGQDLDRHRAVEGGVERLPDRTHAPFADLLDQAVVEQLLPGFDAHPFIPRRDVRLRRDTPRILSQVGGRGSNGAIPVVDLPERSAAPALERRRSWTLPPLNYT